MAILTKVSPSDIANAIGFKLGHGRVLAGATLTAGDAVYVDANGKAQKCVNTVKETTVLTDSGAQTVTMDISRFDGFVFEGSVLGEPVTIFGRDSIVKYGSGLTRQ